jgi:arsenite oxidase small subunit
LKEEGRPKEPPAADSSEADESKREFLKLGMSLSAVLAVGGIAAVSRSISSPAATTFGQQKTFPKVKVANLSSLVVNVPVFFNYPLDNEPNMLVKLGRKASGGVGPDGDIVAFSLLCQHLGCVYSFIAPGSSPACKKSFSPSGPVGFCCCHGSVYDLLSDAKVMAGPSQRPQPHVILDVDSSGDIFAISMGAPSVFGHSTGSDDVTNDLQGGTLVA